MWEEDQRRYYVLAARHLEEVTPARISRRAAKEKGCFCSEKASASAASTRPADRSSKQALKSDPKQASAIHWLLARAYLSGDASRSRSGLWSTTTGIWPTNSSRGANSSKDC